MLLFWIALHCITDDLSCSQMTQVIVGHVDVDVGKAWHLVHDGFSVRRDAPHHQVLVEVVQLHLQRRQSIEFLHQRLPRPSRPIVGASQFDWTQDVQLVHVFVGGQAATLNDVLGEDVVQRSQVLSLVGCQRTHTVSYDGEPVTQLLEDLLGGITCSNHDLVSLDEPTIQS